MCKDHKASISFSMNRRRKARLFREKSFERLAEIHIEEASVFKHAASLSEHDLCAHEGGGLKATTPSAKPSGAQCTPEHARHPYPESMGRVA